MPIRLLRFTIALLAAVPASSMARAADPSGQAAPIHGSDAMDGKNKPGQDGWSWAPVPRDQAASKSGRTPAEERQPGDHLAKSAPPGGT